MQHSYLLSRRARCYSRQKFWDEFGSLLSWHSTVCHLQVDNSEVFDKHPNVRIVELIQKCFKWELDMCIWFDSLVNVCEYDSDLSKSG